MKRHFHERGVTLVELMVTMVLGAIVLLAAVMPFIAERSFWAAGRRQAEAQRDAQMAMRALAHMARQGQGYAVAPTGDSITVNFTGCNRQFQRGGADPHQLLMVDNCVAPSKTTTLIDGVKSQVTQLVFTPVVANKLVTIQLQVTHENQKNETLQTNLFLRNAP